MAPESRSRAGRFGVPALVGIGLLVSFLPPDAGAAEVRAYVADTAKPVYADCVAVWEEDSAEKRRVWALYQAAPPPLGYDPAPFFHSPDHPAFGLLKLTPWRIELYDQGRMQRVWQS